MIRLRKKLEIILIVLVILLIGCTLIYLQNKTEINNNNSNNNDTNNSTNSQDLTTWIITKSVYVEQENTTETIINNIKLEISQDENINICDEDECYKTKYTKENNKLNINCIDGLTFCGNFDFEQTMDELSITTNISESEYFTYYFSRQFN